MGGLNERTCGKLNDGLDQSTGTMTIDHDQQVNNFIGDGMEIINIINPDMLNAWIHFCISFLSLPL